MLGRLRMDIAESLLLYERLGGQIFGHPRRVHISGHPFKGRWWWPRSKYNCTNLETVLQDTINGFVGQPHADGQMDNFLPLRRDQCKTWESDAAWTNIFWLSRSSVIVAVKETPIDKQPFLFHSFDHFKTSDRLVRNPGPAYNQAIWKVARATTAALGFFSPMKLNSKMI